MVLPGDLQQETCSDTAPLSPENVAKANAKNTHLNEYLGMQVEDSCPWDPANDDEEETVDDNSHGFSELELEHVAFKNAMVDRALVSCSEDNLILEEKNEGVDLHQPYCLVLCALLFHFLAIHGVLTFISPDQ